MADTLSNRVFTAINRLSKWRSVFAGWQLGTRAMTDPECQAVRDHREATLILRAEVTALVAVGVKKGLFTQEEFSQALLEEAEKLNADMERRFPGFKASDIGMSMEMPKAAETMKGWKP